MGVAISIPALRRRRCGSTAVVAAFLFAADLFAAEVAAATLTFDETCPIGDRVLVAAVGDLLFHDALQAQALKPGSSYHQFWAPVAPLLASADIVYGNLEGPMAFGVKQGGGAVPDPGRVLDNVVYGRTGDALIYNYHPSLAADLKASGFSVVSTANNHAADRGALGVERTLEALAQAGIASAGTRARDAPSGQWSVRTSAGGMTIAWLACTYSLNDMPGADALVAHCYRDKPAILAEVAALAGDRTVDAVIVTPHWGLEGSPTPQTGDRAYARLLIEAGASAVIATHPHVLQPWEKVAATDGRDGLIIHSTGNFISNQHDDAQRAGIIAFLEFTRPIGGRARLTAASYVPTYVEARADRDHRVVARDDPAALANSHRLLPSGNRVTSTTVTEMPRQCRQLSIATLLAARPQTRPGRTEPIYRTRANDRTLLAARPAARR